MAGLQSLALLSETVRGLFQSCPAVRVMARMSKLLSRHACRTSPAEAVAAAAWQPAPGALVSRSTFDQGPVPDLSPGGVYLRQNSSQSPAVCWLQTTWTTPLPSTATAGRQTFRPVGVTS